MKPNTEQFQAPHPIPALAAGEKPQYENQKFHSPYARYVTNWNAEMTRENKTAEATKNNVDLKELSAKHADWEKNSRRHEADENPYELEVSGDAKSRAQKGQPAKDKFDVKMGFN